MATKMATKLRKNDIVFVRNYVDGYPLGVGPETRLKVCEVRRSHTSKVDQVWCKRDDGRDMSWMIDADNLRKQGEK